MKALIATILVLFMSTQVWAMDKAKEKALNDFFGAVQMEQIHNDYVDELTNEWIQSNLRYLIHTQFILKLYRKFIGWDPMKEYYFRFYSEEFTIKEIKQLKKFYQTSAGRKMFKQGFRVGNKLEQQRQNWLAFKTSHFISDLNNYLKEYKESRRRSRQAPEAVVEKVNEPERVTTFKMSLKKDEKLLGTISCQMTGKNEAGEDVEDCPGYVKPIKMSNGAEVLVGFVQRGDPNEYTETYLIRTIVNGRVQDLGEFVWGGGSWWASIDDLHNDEIQVACAEGPHSSDPGFLKISRLKYDPQANEFKLTKSYNEVMYEPEDPIPSWACFKESKDPHQWWIVDCKQ